MSGAEPTGGPAGAAAGLRLTVWTAPELPEVRPGDDLVALVGDALAGEGVEAGDVVVVTSKIVSKAEGRVVAAADRDAAIVEQTVRIVAERQHAGGATRIVENRLGLVMAAAGVDASNTPEGTILLLPEDPDATALALCRALRERFGVDLGVVVTDTSGRAWREGQTDIAIGAAGIRVADDLRGTTDANGRPLDVTVAAVADEIAAAADLVKGKTSRRPVAIARGLAHLVAPLDAPGARALVRSAATDLFRMGTAEAIALGRAQAGDATPTGPLF
jgi:coenzyme F420-0:L-glutamate ligase / coenzyme F420-1:gamma-L-glutamate ligase